MHFAVIFYTNPRFNKQKKSKKIFKKKKISIFFFSNRFVFQNTIKSKAMVEKYPINLTGIVQPVSCSRWHLAQRAIVKGSLLWHSEKSSPHIWPAMGVKKHEKGRPMMVGRRRMFESIRTHFQKNGG